MSSVRRTGHVASEGHKNDSHTFTSALAVCVLVVNSSAGSVVPMCTDIRGLRIHCDPPHSLPLRAPPAAAERFLTLRNLLRGVSSQWAVTYPRGVPVVAFMSCGSVFRRSASLRVYRPSSHPRAKHSFTTVMASAEEDGAQKRPRAVKIGTHSGSFHCDEALGCYLLRKTAQFEGAPVTRR